MTDEQILSYMRSKGWQYVLILTTHVVAWTPSLWEPGKWTTGVWPTRWLVSRAAGIGNSNDLSDFDVALDMAFERELRRRLTE